MSIAEKLTTIAENVNKVYEAGKTAGGGGNIEDNPMYFMDIKGFQWQGKAFPEGFDFVVKVRDKPSDMNALLLRATGLKSATLICEAEGTVTYAQLIRENTVETLDLSGFKPKPNNISYLCYNSKNFVSIIGALDFSNVHTATSAFAGASALENIEFVPLTIPLPLNFSSCAKLTHASLMSIINGLKDLRATSYDLTDQAEKIKSEFFYEDYNGSFVIEGVDEYGTFLRISTPEGSSLIFTKSDFDENIINILKKVGNKIELDATATGDGANYFPCTINKIVITDYAELPTEAHEISPLPDWISGNPVGTTIYEEIATVRETDTTIEVYGDSLAIGASFQKENYTDEVLSLLKEGNIISCTSTMAEEGTIITACTIYKKIGFQTATLGTTNLAKLTDEEIVIATEKGWTLV